VLVEWPQDLEMRLILGQQRWLRGEAAQQVAGKERACSDRSCRWHRESAREDEAEFAVEDLQPPVMLVDQTKREPQTVMLEQGLGAPVGDHHGVVALHDLVDQQQRSGDVWVLMVADEIADLGERYDLFDLAQRAGKGEARAGIEQDGLVALFQQIDVALKDIVVEDVTDSPDPIGDFDGAAGIGIDELAEV
jgi:hypothetical protein